MPCDAKITKTTFATYWHRRRQALRHRFNWSRAAYIGRALGRGRGDYAAYRLQIDAFSASVSLYTGLYLALEGCYFALRALILGLMTNGPNSREAVRSIGAQYAEYLSARERHPSSNTLACSP
jgi:hypothetical protein